MTLALIKRIFIRGNHEYRRRLLAVKLTGSFSNTEYISSMTKLATVFTIVLYKGSGIDCSPLQCPVPKELRGFLLICETLDQRQEYHYNSPRCVVMPITVFLDNGTLGEADTYVLPVESMRKNIGMIGSCVRVSPPKDPIQSHAQQ
jgi:hypothetical protein